MSDVMDYSSRLSDPASRKMETFSYLPQLTDAELRMQLQYIVDNGWNPAIEHSEPENSSSNYWYMWKLPMFGETDIDEILSEVELCHKSNPGNHVRIIGYNNITQSQGTAFIMHRADFEV